MLAWTRSRQELADRIHVTLEEALAEHRKRSEERASAEKQRQLCQQLTSKVSLSAPFNHFPIGSTMAEGKS